jgi:hypothetical protein
MEYATPLSGGRTMGMEYGKRARSFFALLFLGRSV